MAGVERETAHLLAAVVAGEAEAARELVARCHPLVMRIVRAHRPRTVPEEDLAQEVYLKMFSRLERYEERPGVPFEHWLSRLAVRSCLDVLRGERRRPQSRSTSLGPEGAAWLDSLAGRAEPPVAESALVARQLGDELLGRLPAPDRLVLTLLDVEERSVAEVSRLTGWSAGLVRVRAWRARRRLKATAGATGR